MLNSKRMERELSILSLLIEYGADPNEEIVENR
jgi:hypothetical protein